MLNPETNSDSPSAKSNGVRLVSASIEASHIKNTGNKVKKKYTYSWFKLNSEKLKLKTINTKTRKKKAKEIS